MDEQRLEWWEWFIVIFFATWGVIALWLAGPWLFAGGIIWLAFLAIRRHRRWRRFG